MVRLLQWFAAGEQILPAAQRAIYVDRYRGRA
jgi:hypothetical protein